MIYRQLTQQQRYQIHACQGAGWRQTRIANEIGSHPSTISRELRRNRGQRGYRPQQADLMAQRRRQQKRKDRLTAADWLTMTALLEKEWSPEQISGSLKAGDQLRVSHEWIYQYIYADKAAGGKLHFHLRCQKLRRKRYGKNDHRGQLPNRRSIDDRPAIVAEKTRLGDWEADTIIGKNHQQAIVSLVDRKSKYCLLAKVTANTAAAVATAICRLLRRHRDKVHTITSDNGREFAAHEKIAGKLHADFYFAHPYCSWERGLNENTNGLVRQYCPKGSDFSAINDADLDFVMDRLNNRPRKTLGFKNPNQIFFYQPAIALKS
jgi:transposase, IS30 family